MKFKQNKLYSVFIIICSVFISLSISSSDSTADSSSNSSSGSSSDSTKADQKWWKKRLNNKDIYYPHKIHSQSMNEEGDSCMLCHTFAKNTLVNEKQLKHLTTIANEPLKAICHDCHLEDLRAPWRCNICHTDKTAIWPDDHNYDYIHQHNEDARSNETQCRSCHLDIAFCTNCHFRRGNSGNKDYHPLGYQSRHGIDARMNASQCGRCHNSFYCTNCHRNKQ